MLFSHNEVFKVLTVRHYEELVAALCDAVGLVNSVGGCWGHDDREDGAECEMCQDIARVNKVADGLREVVERVETARE